MFSNRKWNRLGLFLNLFGTALLFLSFQATSSNFRLVSSDGRHALCVDKVALMVKDTNSFAIGANNCPEWERARPAAVVNVERPFLVTLGFIATTLGFLLQYLSVPSPKTIAQIRTELKVAQLKERAAAKHHAPQ